MSGPFESILKVITGIVKLKGASDNTKIGNVGDALKVSANSDIENPSYVSAALNGPGRISKVTIDDTAWFKLPGTPLANRESLAIRNETGFDMVVKYSDGGAYSLGFPINDGEERGYPWDASVDIYGRMAAGSGSVVIDVEELARTP